MANVELKETYGCTRKFAVTVERERLDSQIQETIRKVRHEAQIPGFRKGKAPESLIMRRFGGYVREEAVRDLIPLVLKEVFAEQNVNPIGEPSIDDLKLEETGPIAFTVAVEEMPEIDRAGFDGIAVTKEVQEVTDDDVNQYLDRMRDVRAERVEVDRPAATGDILVVNLQKLDNDGAPIEGHRRNGHVLSLNGHGTPSPEFDRQVVGMTMGEKRTIRFTYDESIGTPELVGTEEAYEVELVKVVENRMPALDDAFAAAIGEYASVKELIDRTRSMLEERSAAAAESKLNYDIMSEFIRLYPFDVPTVMVDRVITSEYDQAKRSYPNQHIDREEFENRIRPDAVKSVQTFVISEAVRKAENIEVSKEELTERMEKIAAATGTTMTELRRRLIKEGNLENLKNEIAQEKVDEWIKSRVKIDVRTVAKQAAGSSDVES